MGWSGQLSAWAWRKQANMIKYKQREKTFYDLHAQVIQHELDHMEGKLCIDYDN